MNSVKHTFESIGNGTFRLLIVPTYNGQPAIGAQGTFSVVENQEQALQLLNSTEQGYRRTLDQLSERVQHQQRALADLVALKAKLSSPEVPENEQ